MATAYFAQFEAELGLLRDRVLGAIETAKPSQAEEGLDLYRDMLTSLLTSHKALATSHADGASSPLFGTSDPYGREWRSLMQDLYGFAEPFAVRSGLRGWIDFCDFGTSIVADAALLDEWPAVADYFRILRAGWVALLTHRADAQRAEFESMLLLRLNNLSIFAGAYGIEGEALDSVRFGVAACFTEMLKAAVDVDDAASAALCFEYFESTFERRLDTESTSELSQYVTRCLMTIIGWVLLQVDRGRADAAARELLPRLAQAVQRTNLWQFAAGAEANSLRPYTDPMWWEMEGRGPRQSGMLVLDGYVLLGVLLFSYLIPPRPDDAVTDQDISLARRLLSVLNDLSSGAYARVAQLEVGQRPSDALRAALDELVAVEESRRKARAIQAEPEPDRIDTFVATIGDELSLTRADRLASFLAERSDDPPVGGPDRPVLGMNTLVPKEYFSSVPGVHADEKYLARDIAGAIRRGEEEKIYDVIQSAVPDSEVVPLEELADRVARHLASTRHANRQLILTNSTQAVDVLCPDAWTDSSRSSRELRTPQGALVFRTYIDAPNFAYVMDRRTSLRVRLSKLQPRLPGDRWIASSAVLVGVSELDEASIQSLLEQDPQRDRGDLLATARVRVLVDLEVAVASSEHLIGFLLADGVW